MPGRVGQELVDRGHTFSVLISSADKISQQTFETRKVPGMQALTFRGNEGVGTSEWAANLSRDPFKVRRQVFPGVWPAVHNPSGLAASTEHAWHTQSCFRAQSITEFMVEQSDVARSLCLNSTALHLLKQQGLCPDLLIPLLNSLKHQSCQVLSQT